jgi:hypothetical protein
MSIYRTDDEDAIVLYHDITHVLARLDLVSVSALQLLKSRLTHEATRHDDLDQHSMTIMAGLVALYITDHEEVVDPNWCTASDAPEGAEG